jgi:hypothetical protein
MIQWVLVNLPKDLSINNPISPISMVGKRINIGRSLWTSEVFMAYMVSLWVFAGIYKVFVEAVRVNVRAGPWRILLGYLRNHQPIGCYGCYGCYGLIGNDCDTTLWIINNYKNRMSSKTMSNRPRNAQIEVPCFAVNHFIDGLIQCHMSAVVSEVFL